MTHVDVGARASEVLAAYAGCGGTVRKYVSTGRLGPIGHVACLDRCMGPVGEGGAGYWFGRGGPLLAELCELLGTRARDVVARTDEPHGVTEAYVATESGRHVHFTGSWRASVDSHCLWIEGARGSLRTDGGVVWWRKRGWRFFVPVRIGTAPKAATLASAARRAAADTGQRGAADDRVALATAAVASSMTRSVVPLSGPGRAAAA